MRSRQFPSDATCADRLVVAPDWQVELTSRRSDGEPLSRPSATIDSDAEALGVEVRVDEKECVARFLTRGSTLEAATRSAFECWELIRSVLGLPEWTATSITVSWASASSANPTRLAGARLHCRSVDPTASTPGFHHPYHLWGPG